MHRIRGKKRARRTLQRIGDLDGEIGQRRAQSGGDPRKLPLEVGGLFRAENDPLPRGTLLALYSLHESNVIDAVRPRDVSSELRDQKDMVESARSDEDRHRHLGQLPADRTKFNQSLSTQLARGLGNHESEQTTELR
jgi:hypothetical protein